MYHNEQNIGYKLSRLEGKLGGPERPLSEQGYAAYMSYWRECVILSLNAFLESTVPMSLEGISVLLSTL